MTKRITAEYARQLAGPTPAEYVDSALKAIEKTAIKKERSIIFRGDFWNGGYNDAPRWLDVKKELEALGYEVEFYYQEGSQFVDMGTKVSW